MKTNIALILVGLLAVMQEVRLQNRDKLKANSLTITNYVTLPKEFGPDGYGFKSLTKQDHELIRTTLESIGGNLFSHASFFEDLFVTNTVTHDLMTISEILDLISKNPNVAGVGLRMDSKRSVFSLNTLAYPQYEGEYRLTKEQWKTLQDYCRLQLINPVAVDDVVEHWKSIVKGTPPFGLSVK